MPPVPIYVKGGVWTNVEDQILKAAVQKYGTHQWSKVASLLQKKTARQSELRWNEYLNPKLNFTEFSKEEDAQLLDLARELPNQWRTIADMMARPAQVCVERYNRLLESEDSGGAALSTGVTDLKVGDINPNAETQMARPDNGDLEGEEKEMLAEARARLLNTQGKKATRKIRERMLEESKRIAELQKRRELKQAGINVAIKKPKKKYGTDIDYNEDIVYEQAPMPGIYDTSTEDRQIKKKFEQFERKVNRKGLDGNKDKPSKKNKDKKRKHDENEHVEKAALGESTTLTDEYKKPKLILSAPGTKQGKVTYKKKLESKRQKLIEAQATGTVLTPKELLPHEPGQEDNERSNIKSGKQLKSRIRKFLVQMFASLPSPKNDFEIVLSEDEKEEDAEIAEYEKEFENERAMNEEDNFIEPPSQKDAPCVSLVAVPLAYSTLPIPEFKNNPQSAIDNKYNLLVANAINKEPHMVPEDTVDFLKEVESRMQHITQGRTSMKIQFKTAMPPTEVLLESIQSKVESIEQLQRKLQHVQPLEQQNNEMCSTLCHHSLPALIEGQRKYYADYYAYRQEIRSLEGRRKRLQAMLNSSSSI
ncbi:BDC_1c_G0042740.mRNA.1.CDS.1 [Saccharomyces cerevisiae]|nr:BDF_1d_G0042720.mRNA.1.CDS.1 [Saccharomyces cerevisiae]CAI4684436.1 BDC_1c_G0042740.mRNA.1.CDS.1 [Saccharomyces cerevisiae]CAI7284985.1 BDF_1d_G0042720.mRNA.1.CDS.1 [Saccharomyces cerevisiae]CAI7287187.1 BDC_1c_G0042740.mRNA.1.CDS.1 [Saccharomyces cerevisiae]